MIHAPYSPGAITTLYALPLMANGFTIPSSPCVPHHCCPMCSITVALCAPSLLPCTPPCHCHYHLAPCHCCPLCLIIVAPCTLLLSPHMSHCCHCLLCWCCPMHPIVVALCALLLSPHMPYYHCPMHLIAIALCTLLPLPCAPCCYCLVHLVAIALCTLLPLALCASLPSSYMPRCCISHSKFFRMP